MAHNRGKTSLKSSLRNEDPMQDFDRLSQELRACIAAADLPWRPRSVRKIFEHAFIKTGSREKAFEEFSRIQRRLVSKDAERVWGKNHPDAGNYTQT